MDHEQIGARLGTIRRRRGMSMAYAASQAGISKPYWSMLENGQRRFEKRGLLETLAGVLHCAVSDLTGEPYLPGDRESAEALATLPPISAALHDSTLDDVSRDLPVRPVDHLAGLAARANAASADSRYGLAGRALGDLLTELHVHAVTGNTDTRRAALRALTEACIVAIGTARTLGNNDLAAAAAQRAQDAAARLEDAALGGFAAMSASIVLGRMGARNGARRTISAALNAVSDADPDKADSAPAEAAGMLHLASAQLAAKSNDADTARTHLDLAAELADRTGERSTLHYDFGPANVQAWSLSLAVELGAGPERAEQITSRERYDSGLTSRERRAALHFDLARAYTQAEGARDNDAVRHLDLADQVAPLRIRHDPIAHEVLAELDMRARRRAWELDSLKARLRVG
ncbi:helix-turn-helix transcriptional regulator [Amycolatopsis mediterranei]|uniref:helix-turn-helix domain-containing protein n=1 Tax=Amycolatopsis mediterranei TaxID=33910 RepID=UPI00342A0BAB